MRKITPFKTINETIQSLDNGGQFYHIQTKAKDWIINQSELGKVGGVFNDKQQMILFLEMSMMKLTREEKNVVISMLDSDLQKTFAKYKSQELLSSEAHEKGIISSNVIMAGIPKKIDANSDFKGFLMFPVMSGSVITFMMIPIVDKYDVYEIRDEASAETFFIAHSNDSERFMNKKAMLGGVLKEMKANENEQVPTKKFLEVTYYIELE
jgi:hypothetical protein